MGIIQPQVHEGRLIRMPAQEIEERLKARLIRPVFGEEHAHVRNRERAKDTRVHPDEFNAEAGRPREQEIAP